MKTKELLLETALDMFSRLGYAGVSVRDLTKAVGLRESALYKHYASKEQLLEAIVDRAADTLRAFQNGIRPDKTAGQTVCALMKGVFNLYVRDPFMNRFRKLMVISQYENPQSRTRYGDMFVEKSISYYRTVFAEVLTRKGLEGYDPESMAIELYAPLYLLMQRYDCETDPAALTRAEALLDARVAAFFERYPFLED